MWIQSLKVALIYGLSILVSQSARAMPSDYTFTKLVDSTSGLSNFGTPIINSLGQVAFATATSNAVLLWRADPQKQILIAQGLIDGFSINNSGTVAFAQGTDNSPISGVYTSDGTAITPVIESKPGHPGLPWRFTSGRGSVSINNNGTIIFTGAGPVSGGLPSLFSIKNGNVTQLAKEADYGTLAFASNTPRLNDQDLVVFKGVAALVPPGNPSYDILYSVNASGGAVAPLIKLSDLPANSTVGKPFSVNNKNQIAFGIEQNFNSPFNYYLATTQGNDIKILIQAQYRTGTFKFDIVGGPGVNDNGEIVFDGYYNAKWARRRRNLCGKRSTTRFCHSVWRSIVRLNSPSVCH